MNIYFAGNLKSKFIADNLSLLKEEYDITVFDLSKHAVSFSQVPQYLIHSLEEWRNIYNSDIVWIWFADYPAIPFLIWAKLFGKKIVVNVGGWEVYAAAEIGYGNQLHSFRGAVTRWILRNSDICVCMSEAYEKIIKRVESKSEVVVVPGWIELELCSGSLPEKHGVVTAFITYNQVEILKGIDTFKAATTGIEATVLHDISHETLIDAFKQAKVYCQLSYTESFGMSLLEAMACGCVPVVTDRDALPEVAGGAGIIVPYGDVVKTHDAIILALTMDGRASRICAMRFNKEMSKAKTKDMIRRLKPCH